MQIILEFSTEMLNLPISYNAIVQGFIYHTLMNSNPEYSAFIHNKGQEVSRNDFKLFNFGRLTGDYKVRGTEIIFPKKASLEIRSADEKFIQYFLYGCRKGELIKLGHNYVRLENCELKNKLITSEDVFVYTKSPFTFHSIYPECHVFEKESVVNKLIKNAKEKWLSAGFDEVDFRLDVSFDDSIPKEVHSVFKNVYNIAWDCSFELKGNVETLNFIYNTGIGSKNSQGFGMFELSKAKL